MKSVKTPPPSEITAGALRILYWFFACPNTDFTFSEICKQTNTAKKTGQIVIEELFKRQLVAKTELGKLWRLRANTESKEFRRAKIAYNLSLIYESGIVDIILKKYPQSRAVILFGSYRKGDDIFGSDVDIALEVPGTRETILDKTEHFSTFGYRTNVPISIHIFSRKHIDSNVFANIANGIVLEGFLEVRA